MKLQSTPTRRAVRSIGQKIQRGFTLIELGVVIVIIAVIGAFSLPAINSYIIEGKVQPVVDDVTALTSIWRGNAAAVGGPTPYNTMGANAAAVTGSFSTSAIGKAKALTPNGTGATATMTHPLGATNAAVTAGIGTLTAAGDSFTITFANI